MYVCVYVCMYICMVSCVVCLCECSYVGFEVEWGCVGVYACVFV